MSDEDKQAEEATEEEEESAAEGADGEAEGTAEAAPDEEPEWAAELDEYPLREPSEDPGWAVWIVRIWVGFTVFCIVFILVLIVLGFWYD